MKKIIAMLLALTLAMGLVACGTGSAGAKEDVPASALEILENVWGKYAEDEKFFVMGGDMNNMVNGAPGKFDVADTDGMTYTLLVPADQVANVDDAASVVHGMLTNNFTCGVFHVADAAAFAKAMQENVMGNQWMCGMPERLIVEVIGGEYVLMAFGITDAMTTFAAHLAEAYPNASVVCDQPLAG